MNTFRSLAAAALGATVTGCFSPHTVATRHFILTPAPATAAATSDVRLGVGVVKMPDYLLSNSLAVRKSAGEIGYLEGALWAERLDKGFTRVLAADLSAMIPTDQVLLGAWRTDDVTLEVHVTVEQFDVDQGGTGTLVASGVSPRLEARRFSRVGKHASPRPVNRLPAIRKISRPP